MSAMIFLALRASHVLMAAVWIGSTVFVSTQLMPAIDASGSSGGQVLQRLSGRLTAYMGALGAMTVVTGLYLLWHFAGAFSEIGTTHAGIAFGIGGTAGILAGVIGAIVVGRGAHLVTTLMGQAAGMADGPAKLELLQRVTPLRQRVAIGSKAVIVLQMLALLLMSIGHYV